MNIKDQDLQLHKRTIVTGRVAYINPYYATLDLEHGNRAYLNINQFAIVKPSSLSDVLAIGDELNVKLLFFRKKRMEWESSKLALDGPELLQKLDIIGKTISSKITRIVDKAILIDLGNNLTGRIDGIHFDILWNARILEIGKPCNVVIKNWHENGKDVYVIPAFNTKNNSIMVGEVRAILKSTPLKNHDHYLKQRLLVKLESGDICSCDVSNFVDIESRFKPGTTVKCSISIINNRFRWPLRGEIILSRSDKTLFGSIPSNGKEMEVFIRNVKDHGASCIIADDKIGFINHTEVINDAVAELDKYLHPGDKVQVRVSNKNNNKVSLDFINLVENFNSNQSLEEISTSLLFELKDRPIEITQIKYQRDQNFREKVLSTYKNRCVFCGISQKVSEDFSAAEAAHIIPRAKRGSDSLNNALCFCGFHHWAFDRGLISISNDELIMVSNEIDIRSELGKGLLGLHRQNLVLPPEVELSQAAIQWHQRNIFID